MLVLVPALAYARLVNMVNLAVVHVAVLLRALVVVEGISRHVPHEVRSCACAATVGVIDLHADLQERGVHLELALDVRAHAHVLSAHGEK